MYIGNCANLFDEDGNCLSHIFYDVSDFARHEEEVREAIDEGRDILLTKEDFECIKQVNLKIFGRVDFSDFEFYFYPEAGTFSQVYVAYDRLEDIHYFFA